MASRKAASRSTFLERHDLSIMSCHARTGLGGATDGEGNIRRHRACMMGNQLNIVLEPHSIKPLSKRGDGGAANGTGDVGGVAGCRSDNISFHSISE